MKMINNHITCNLTRTGLPLASLVIGQPVNCGVGRLIIKENYTWEDVVRECEDLLQMNGHAASPLQSNLPNVIRDLIFKVIGSPRASQPTTPADGGNRRPKPFIPDIDDIMSGPGP